MKGTSTIKNETKLKLFSLWESELLEVAIKEKISLTKNIQKKLRGQQNIPLSDVDNKHTIEHFEKKISFYMNQNKDKWKEWPNKSTKKKTVNFKRRQKRNKKKTKDNAKKAIDSGCTG